MATATNLRVHAIQHASFSNGPGKRSVIWVQGCSLGCPGCFNPATHPNQGGMRFTVDQILSEVLLNSSDSEGISLSGGEPFQQAPALLNFFQQITKLTRLSILVFSGYSLEELRARPESAALLPYIDILIAGRFVQTLLAKAPLLGSANQKIHFLSTRYTPQDLSSVPDGEIWIDPDGHITYSGIRPLSGQG